MKRLIYSPRPCLLRLNRGTTHSLRLAPQGSVDSTRAYTDPVVKQNFDSRKQAITDRHHLDSQSTEYTSSGTDTSVAERSDVSFDPAKSLDPERARELAAEGTGGVNPLEVSPANPAVSRTSEEAEGGKKSWSEKKEAKGFFGKKAKGTDGRAGEQQKERVFKGFDRRKEGQTPRYVQSGSR